MLFRLPGNSGYLSPDTAHETIHNQNVINEHYIFIHLLALTPYRPTMARLMACALPHLSSPSCGNNTFMGITYTALTRHLSKIRSIKYIHHHVTQHQHETATNITPLEHKRNVQTKSKAKSTALLTTNIRILPIPDDGIYCQGLSCVIPHFQKRYSRASLNRPAPKPRVGKCSRWRHVYEGACGAP